MPTTSISISKIFSIWLLLHEIPTFANQSVQSMQILVVAFSARSLSSAFRRTGIYNNVALRSFVVGRPRNNLPATGEAACRSFHATSTMLLGSSGGGSESFRTTTQSTLPPIPDHAHRFVLMRHGESEFNNANIFTGWCDVALTQRGVVEAVEAGQVFRSHDIQFRKCYTSMLTRSIVTAQRSLEAAGVAYTPLVYDWRMNERHYGALQGLSKERTAVRLGRARVMEWRRSFAARPPVMTPDHPHYAIINADARYKKVPNIPLGESLEDCQVRVVEGWKEILCDVQRPMSMNGDTADDDDDDESNYSLVVAHANTLRALVMHLDDIPAEEIESLNIPTAIPFYYDIDMQTGEVLSDPVNGEDASASASDKIGLGRFRGIYISDERKRRNFLERRRAANDPWLWALHDHQVARSLLVDNENDNENGDGEGLDGIEEEAKHNTEVFSTAMQQQHQSKHHPQQHEHPVQI